VIQIAAVDGEDSGAGLAVFRTGHFELVCLDSSMPAMDELKTMRTLRDLQAAIRMLVQILSQIPASILQAI
jgi:CheY-like chemotaxis protein